jgi:two-component system phosphate regulon response regulator PhoB
VAAWSAAADGYRNVSMLESEDLALAPRTSRRVLIVERDAAIAATLHSKLTQAGFQVTTLGDSERTLTTIESDQPDLVMLDWDLPGVIALDLIGRIRRASAKVTPRVIILSNLAGERQIVTGFEAGADDYVVKPCSAPEVVARVRAVLRSCRLELEPSQLLTFRELQINRAEVRLSVRGLSVALRSSEYRLLEVLLANPERAFNREQLLARVWGHDVRSQPRAIDVTVQRLRRALARYECDHYVQTVRGVGYRLSAASEPRAAVR